MDGAYGGDLMIDSYFKAECARTDVMHADPAAALDAVKLASLAAG